MNAPNAAVGALPGWRGTDPDGGTWVRRAEDAIYPWHEIDARGELYWRSQEEAEAASLVPLVSQAHVDDLKKAWQEHIESVRDQRDSLASDLSSANDEIARLADAAPAPLDPGNPEHLPEFDEKNATHLRWLADAIGDAPLPWASDEENHPEREQANDEMTETVEQFADFWRSEADRLDRERAEAEQAEAEQDTSDRKRAAELVEQVYAAADGTFVSKESIALAGIRAERARQEAGQ